MSKTFDYFGVPWTAYSSGSASGAGFFGSALPPLTSFGVIFRSAWGDFRGWINGADPAGLTDDELRDALRRTLERQVFGAIDQSRYTWRPAEAISKETHIPLERVREILEAPLTDDVRVIKGPKPNSQGYALYTTRDHLVRTTGDVIRRYGDVETSS